MQAVDHHPVAGLEPFFDRLEAVEQQAQLDAAVDDLVVFIDDIDELLPWSVPMARSVISSLYEACPYSSGRERTARASTAAGARGDNGLANMPRT